MEGGKASKQGIEMRGWRKTRRGTTQRTSVT